MGEKVGDSVTSNVGAGDGSIEGVEVFIGSWWGLIEGQTGEGCS